MEKPEGASGIQNQGQRMVLHVRLVLLIVQHQRSLLKHLIPATGYMGILLMNKSPFWSLKTMQSFSENTKLTTIKKIREVR